jgi:hypothetical protein
VVLVYGVVVDLDRETSPPTRLHTAALTLEVS